MGFFGKISGLGGSLLRKFGEIGKESLKKFGSVKHAYNNVNNALGGMIGKTLESIPIAGPLLQKIGQVLDNKSTMSSLENVLDHARVYGRDFEKLGNKLIKEGK
jgi:hypothetical protein